MFKHLFVRNKKHICSLRSCGEINLRRGHCLCAGCSVPGWIDTAPDNGQLGVAWQLTYEDTDCPLPQLTYRLHEQCDRNAGLTAVKKTRRDCLIDIYLCSSRALDVGDDGATCGLAVWHDDGSKKEIALKKV